MASYELDSSKHTSNSEHELTLNKTLERQDDVIYDMSTTNLLQSRKTSSYARVRNFCLEGAVRKVSIALIPSTHLIKRS